MSKECYLCNYNRDLLIAESANFVVLYDEFPVTEGHALIFPKLHVKTFFDVPVELIPEYLDMIDYAKNHLSQLYGVTDFNLGWNCGEAAGQTVMHCHAHLIPRRNGDMEDPRGGVRGVIPEKQKY
jgi:diadenosine tetraphosphate (Ap4A) HIT family hydrolase